MSESPGPPRTASPRIVEGLPVGDAASGPSSSTMMAAQGEFSQPCVVNAFLSALPSGILGWTFGFLPSLFRNVGLKHFRTWLDDGRKSGMNFFVLSGTYSLSQCIISRVRQVDDAYNRGFAGCATGLAMGWSAGASSAIQSCVGIGLLSYLLDFGGPEEPAKASSCCTVALGSPSSSTKIISSAGTGMKTLNKRHQRSAASMLRLSPVMWMGAVSGPGGRGYLQQPSPWEANRS